MSDTNTTMFIANLIEETDTKNEKIIEKRKIATLLNQLNTERADIQLILKRALIMKTK